ncbi:7347_t:CDS:2 [Dentiscutata heterogama]|uniref:7347_t:CDS:1 n=1 Tax=Dentiscutata heterogama TaxID=1316150 RepID=A0ACA9JVP4_9GLOM|nr:7347_t:CDS:2 [Dentiscutata heterogama]
MPTIKVGLKDKKSKKNEALNDVCDDKISKLSHRLVFKQSQECKGLSAHHQGSNGTNNEQTVASFSDKSERQSLAFAVSQELLEQLLSKLAHRLNHCLKRI